MLSFWLFFSDVAKIEIRFFTRLIYDNNIQISNFRIKTHCLHDFPNNFEKTYLADLNLFEMEMNEEKPPFFKKWEHLYAFVLVMHVLIIVLFYWFTKAYS